MKLSTKGQYAVQAMVDLAMHSPGKAVSLVEIAERQTLPVSYLEQLFAKLKKAGLVISIRGQGGGYSLARPSETISIADVMRAVEEIVKTTRCSPTTDIGCQGTTSRCLTHHLWKGLEKTILRYLTSISLADVVQGESKRLQEVA